MPTKLKQDILKSLGRNPESTVFGVGGIGGLTKEDLDILLRICDLFSETGDIGGYRDMKLRRELCEVLVKYKMW